MTRICLLLFLCLFLLTGCSQGSSSSVESAQDKAPPTKTFESPSLSFDYPGNLFEKTSTNGNIIFMATTLDPAEDQNNLTYYDLQELVVLNVIQKIEPQVSNIEQLRQKNLRDIQQLGKVSIISGNRLLQKDTPVLEYTLNSPQGSFHIKQYLHYTKNGDTLVVSLSTPQDNWHNITDVVKTVEKSLHFKE